MVDNRAKNRLGRGLAALIGDIDPTQEPKTAEPNIKADLVAPIELVRANPNNPRRLFLDAELEDLANSISEHGIVQPVLVRTITNDDLAGVKYEIIAGERRWRAAQKAGLHEIPILVREVDDRQALEIAIIENVQRTDLNPVEEAMGYQQLMNEYDYTQNELAQIIGKSRSHVANTLRLLKLPDEVCQMVASGELSAGHARTLVTSDDPLGLAKRIIKDGLSVRQAESLSQNKRILTGGNKESEKTGIGKSTDILALESRLSDALGLNVSISFRKNGAGDVKVQYRNLEQLDEICRRLER